MVLLIWKTKNEQINNLNLVKWCFGIGLILVLRKVAVKLVLKYATAMDERFPPFNKSIKSVENSQEPILKDLSFGGNLGSN